jgi:hypothetical protein
MAPDQLAALACGGSHSMKAKDTSQEYCPKNLSTLDTETAVNEKKVCSVSRRKNAGV